MGTATQAFTKMIIEIALEVNNPETFALSGERRLRINSSQFSGGSPAADTKSATLPSGSSHYWLTK
jgi:hypothetical protein